VICTRAKELRVFVQFSSTATISSCR